MKKIVLIYSLLFLLVSCSSLKVISGKKFKFNSNNRELILHFENDSLCILKNTFYCDDIEEQYKEIIVKSKYERRGDSIFLKNINCKQDDCNFSTIIEIPIQNSLSCDFLNEESRQSKVLFDGRSYKTKYHEFGLVPNVDIDTLYINKKSIIFVKKIKNGNFGFVFK